LSPEEFNVSATQTRSPAGSDSAHPPGALRLEVITLPVADADRAKRFYGGLGWRLDADIVAGTAVRIVQFTPPGSPCSIQFGRGLTVAVPGSAQRLYLVVADVAAARADLIARGADVGEVFHLGGPAGRQSGPDPARTSYASFASFNDPDGNSWLLQEVTVRLPGRVDTDHTTFGSAGQLAAALRRAEAAHAQHEKRTGQRDENWPDWYADYIVREQAGLALPL
jgi:catechol 2,3-dioxygenase-like lactoylglutathione lyase family enzyme